MPVYLYIMNAVLAALVVGGIVGLLAWSVATQHRQAECEHLRLRRRRLRISVGLVPRELPVELIDGRLSVPNL